MVAPTLESLGKFGWKKDPPKGPSDKPDFVFKLDRNEPIPNDIPELYPKLKAVHSGDVDLSPHTTQSNQYKAGSCFPAGTPILMADFTERPIELVAPGNMVRTHKGGKGRVTEVFRREHKGLAYKVKVQGWGYPLTCTGEHPIGVVRFDSVEWVNAEDLKPGDFVLMPAKQHFEDGPPARIQVLDYLEDKVFVDQEAGTVRLEQAQRGHSIPLQIEVTENFARLVGLFLAEGSFRKSHGKPDGLHWTFARHERSYQDYVKKTVESIFHTEAEVKDPRKRPSVSDVRVDNATLARFFYNLCGEWALCKRLDSVFYRSPRRVRLALLRGWLEGDGSQKPVQTKYKDGRPYPTAHSTGVTSSEELHRGLFRLALLSGLKPSGTIRKKASHQNAEGRNLAFYSKNILPIFPEARGTIEGAGINMTGRTWYKDHDLGFLCRVKSVEIVEVDCQVYNLEVESEHTYVANGVAVHNCAGNATADSVEILNSITGLPKVQLSRLFVYTLARNFMDMDHDGRSDINYDDGTYIRLCFEALSKFGICREDIGVKEGGWPYDVDRYGKVKRLHELPSLKAMRAATGHRIHSYYRITATGNDRLDEIISALRANHPVVFGTLVDKNFVDLTNEGPVGPPKGDTVGGHAMIVVGYLSGKGFIVKNSWGIDWGDFGRCIMDPGYLLWSQTSDLWVPTMGVSF